jgi:hypothetical protein
MTTPATAEASIFGRLEFALTANTRALESAERRRAEMAAAVSYISDFPALQFAAVPFAPGNGKWGPKPGFNWAIQNIAVAGLGTADYLTVYRGNSKEAVQPNNARHTFTVAVAGAVDNWHPGRTGLVLIGREVPSLCFSGSISAAITVSGELIQVADEQLPYFLL